jgi:hypothetical protein
VTAYVFFPPSGQSLTWSNTALWAGGTVPDSATADVYIAPVLVSQTAQSAAFVLDLPAGQSVTLGTLEIGGNTLQLEGALQVGGPVAILGGAGLLLEGGTASAASWTLSTSPTPGNVNNSNILGFGTVAATGAFVNHGLIEDNSAQALTITAATLYNDGTVFADYAGSTVTLSASAAGGGLNVSGGVLTGGTYSVGDGATLDLSLGGIVTTLAATVDLSSGSGVNTIDTLNSYDPVGKSYVSLQSSLTTIAATGLLSVSTTIFTTANALTVNGAVDLNDAAQLNAASLTIGAQGVITVAGRTESITANGGIVNNGTILVSTIDGQYPASSDLVINGAVSGSGTIEIAGESYLAREGGIATLELNGAVSQSVAFLGQTGTLILDQPQAFSGSLSFSGGADTVQLDGVSLSAITNLAYGGNVLSFQEGGASYALHISGSHTLADFSLTSGPQALTTSPPSIILSLGASSSVPVMTLYNAEVAIGTHSLSGLVQIQDYATDLSLDQLQSVAVSGQLQSTIVLDPSRPIYATADQITTDAAALSSISGSYSLIATGVTAAQAASVAGLSHVTQVAISDSSADIAASLDSLQTLAALGKVQTITLTDQASVPLALTEAQLKADAQAVDLIYLGTAHGMTVSAAAAADAFAIASGPYVSSVSVTDDAADVSASLDQLEALAKLGLLGSITLTDGAAPILQLTSAQDSADAAALAKISGTYTVSIVSQTGASLDAGAAVAAYQTGALPGAVSVTDTTANVAAELDSLSAMATDGQLSALSLSNGWTLNLTPSQAAADGAALALLPITDVIDIATANSAVAVSGIANHGTMVSFAGTASLYTITPAGDGSSFTVSGNGVTDSFANIQALHFSDHTEIVATAPGASGITSGNIAELYAAVFDREPDLAGLTYYENGMKANPGTAITTYAEGFLQSPEYTGNPAHDYAQTPAGDTQFIIDTYNNLLHRAPEAAGLAFYQASIANIVGNATPGTAAYTAAELLAHATILANFSASPEFLADVQVTAAHPADATHWLVLI